MRQFSAATMSRWVSEQLYSEGDDSLITDFVKLYSAKRDEGSQEECKPMKDVLNEF